MIARSPRPGAGCPLGLVVLAIACSEAADPPPVVEPPATEWTFRDQYAASGIRWYMEVANQNGAADMYDHGSGIAVGDIDGDSHDDLVLLSQCGTVGYFLGRGDGTFTDASSRLAMLNDGIRTGVAYGDYDQDGRVDLFVSFVMRPGALLRQNDDGSFTDTAVDAGVEVMGHYTGAAFADVDGDGDLDLVVAGTKRYTLPEVIPADGRCPTHFDGRPVLENYGPVGSDPTALFINSGAAGGHRFTNEAAARGIPLGGDGDTNRGFGDLSLWDAEQDGDIDLLLTDMFGTSAALENDGTGHFTDVSGSWFPQFSWGATSATVGDWNNDGKPDLFVTDMHSDMWLDPGVSYSTVIPDIRYLSSDGPKHRTLGAGDNPTGPLYGNCLFLSQDGGGFREAALELKAETYQPWGSVVEDFDNDGDQDIFVPTGMGIPFDYMPNAMLVYGDGTFTRQEKALLLDPPPQGAFDPERRVLGQPTVAAGQAAALGDFNEDGARDLVVMNWGNRLGIYINRLPPGPSWLDVKLVGQNGLVPVGAAATVKVGGWSTTRFQEASRGYLSQSSPWLHFGLGERSGPLVVTVRWPGGMVSDHPIETANRRVELRRPE